MTDSERDKNLEVRETLIQLAKEFTDLWPQSTEDGQPIYLFAGSFAIDLLALSQTCIENNGEPVPLSFKSRLQPFIRPVEDVDIVPLILERSPDVLMAPNEKVEKLDKLVKSGELQVDKVYDAPGTEKYYFVTINDRAYTVERFDMIAASKLLSCLTGFERKPDILNREIPAQINLAIEMYGEDHVWELIRQSYRAELDMWNNGAYWMTVGYKVHQLLKDEKISLELKALVKKAADLAGVDYTNVELDDF